MIRQTPEGPSRGETGAEMYKLTLTRDERRAIDWIGDRYSHGDDLYRLLVHESLTDGDWDEDDGNMTFDIPENVAWSISDVIEADGLACFGPELCEKLYRFQGSIV